MLRRRETWPVQRLREHQQRELAALRHFAEERSPYYRRFHRGLAGAPLHDLPLLTKATMMDNFDDLVTDRLLQLPDLQAYLDTLHGNEPFAGRYFVSANLHRGSATCASCGVTVPAVPSTVTTCPG
jgi:hypothetical protein